MRLLPRQFARFSPTATVCETVVPIADIVPLGCDVFRVDLEHQTVGYA